VPPPRRPRDVHRPGRPLGGADMLEETGGSDVPGTAMESTVSGGLAAFATALAAAHPAMAVPIAGTAAGIQAWLPRARDRVFARRTRSVLLMAPAASDEGEMPFAEVLDAVGDDGAREMFVGDVVDASARSNFDPKLIALGRALAKGVLTPDEVAFQQEVNFVRTLARLEAPHIRVLQVIRGSLSQQRGIMNRALIHGWELSDIVQAVPEFGEFAVQLLRDPSQYLTILKRQRKHADQRGQSDRSELFDGLIEGAEAQ
jgi:hypothetical protein